MGMSFFRKHMPLLQLLLLAGCFITTAQEGSEKMLKIDSVRIRKNWRTRNAIILRELEFSQGQTVSRKQIETSISKIWNIGNFAKVAYRMDSLPGNRNLLTITAQDAFTVVPNISFNGNRQEFLASAGIIDNNFLGRNIHLNLAGAYGTNTHNISVAAGIPRQLLYKNMTLRGGFTYGTVERYRISGGLPVSGIGYLQKQVYLSMGNPNNQDYHYTFSPDLSISYFSHATDSDLLSPGVEQAGSYHIQYLAISTSESVGTINQRRHQQNGFQLAVGLGYGIGLTKGSNGYFSGGISGAFAKLLNRVIELSAGFYSGITTANKTSLLYYLGPDQVKGILSGERVGQSLYNANAGVHFTYVNRDWFAIEQTFFYDIGNATGNYFDLYRNAPLYSFGSKIRLMVPMVPWLAINFYYACMENGKSWFSVEF